MQLPYHFLVAARRGRAVSAFAGVSDGCRLAPRLVRTPPASLLSGDTGTTDDSLPLRLSARAWLDSSPASVVASLITLWLLVCLAVRFTGGGALFCVGVAAVRRARLAAGAGSTSRGSSGSSGTADAAFFLVRRGGVVVKISTIGSTEGTCLARVRFAAFGTGGTSTAGVGSAVPSRLLTTDAWRLRVSYRGPDGP